MVKIRLKAAGLGMKVFQVDFTDSFCKYEPRIHKTPKTNSSVWHHEQTAKTDGLQVVLGTNGKAAQTLTRLIK